MKKSIILMTCCVIVVTTIVFALHVFSLEIVRTPGSFLRIYKKGAVTKFDEMDMGTNSWYIVEVGDSNIYLGNLMTPFRLMIVNINSMDTVKVRLRLLNKNQSIHRSAKVRIQFPWIYLTDGSDATVYRGKIGEWIMEQFISEGSFFNQILPISKESFAIRATSSKTYENALGKLQKKNPRLQFDTLLLQKQVDGIFCTDGMLLYNQKLKKLIYTYYYRNEYIVYDTNLSLNYRGHTIDTFNLARIKVSHINSDNTNILASRKYVNILSSTSGDNLFVVSNVLSKNDLSDALIYQSLIDVYNLKDNSYKFSFTIPNRNGKKVRDFKVYQNTLLIALYDHYLIKYDLKDNTFEVNDFIKGESENL